MPAYVDASALVKRYVAEVGSAWVRRLLAHPAQYVIYLPESEYPVVLAYRRQPMQRHTGIVRTIREGPQDLALTDRVGLPHDAQAFESEGEIDSTVDIIANKKRYESHRQRGFRYLPPAGGGWEGGKACMDSYPVPPAILQAARDLRQHMTDAEQCLWHCLRGKQLDGFRFRKQHPMARFVLDFYCPTVQLAIEIDGAQHNTSPGRVSDEERTHCLTAHGIRVLRFWNHEVLQDLPGVLQRVWDALHLPPSCPPPAGGR